MPAHREGRLQAWRGEGKVLAVGVDEGRALPHLQSALATPHLHPTFAQPHVHSGLRNATLHFPHPAMLAHHSPYPMLVPLHLPADCIFPSLHTQGRSSFLLSLHPYLNQRPHPTTLAACPTGTLPLLPPSPTFAAFSFTLLCTVCLVRSVLFIFSRLRFGAVPMPPIPLPSGKVTGPCYTCCV